MPSLNDMDVDSSDLTLDNLPLSEAAVDSDNEEEPRWKPRRVVLGAVLVLCLLLIVIDSFTSKRVEAATLVFLEWVQENPLLGVLGVILIYTLATVLFVPGSILTLGTGFAFGTAFDSTAKGVAFASGAVFVGASVGSIASFLLGRYLFRDFVVQLASSYPIFCAVDRALQGNGLKIMILLRLSPLIPYNALDYMSGITAVSLLSYTVALLAMLPGIVMFCFIGATASSLADTTTSSENSTARTISLLLGVTFAILGVSVAAYYSKVELNKILAADGTEQSVLLTEHKMVLPKDENDQGSLGESGIGSSYQQMV